MPQLLPSVTVLHSIPKLPKGNIMKPVSLSLTQESAQFILKVLIELPFKQVNSLVHYIDDEIRLSQQEMPTNTITVAPAQKYGLKKDGTPRKRPGRPIRKATK